MPPLQLDGTRDAPEPSIHDPATFSDLPVTSLMQQMTVATASVTLIHFQWPSSGADLAPSIAQSNRLVIRLSELAQAFNASLHSIAGDSILATWNTTRPVPVFYCGSACIFALAVRGFFKQLAEECGIPPEEANCGGAVASGTARCAIAGNDQLRMLVVSAPDVMHRASAMLRISKAHRTVLCDSKTQAKCSTVVATRGVAVFPGDSRIVATRIAYEVLEQGGAPLGRFDDDDSQLESDPDAMITAAVLAHAEGRQEDAVRILEDLSDRVPRVLASTTLTRRLVANILGRR
jgi:hypothetical protein